MTSTVMAAGSSEDLQDPLSSIPTPLPAADSVLETLSLGPIQHIAHYSDTAGVLSFDLSNLRMFKEPSVPRDMNQGKAACIRTNRKNLTFGHPRSLDAILRACEAHCTLEIVSNAHVVTWRGVITK